MVHFRNRSPSNATTHPVKTTEPQLTPQAQIPQGYFIPMPVQNAEPEDEISLVDLWRVLVSQKWLIVSCMGLCFVTAVIVALTMTPVYRAEVLLAPASSDSGNSGGIAALANQFGGLAGMAGISMGGGGTIETAIATLKSRKFITGFIDELKLKPVLFKKQWDNANGQWLVAEPSLLSQVISAITPSPELGP